MKSMPWFRMYTDFLNDPKMISLAFEDQRHFIGVLALKSEGIIDQDCDAKILDRIVAQRLWVDYAIIDDVKTRLLNAGLIDVYWQPTAWDKRQCRSDKDESGAERQRRYRENHSNALRNGIVTLPEESRQEEIREEKTLVVSKLTPCPQQAIISLYAEHLSALPQPRVWDGARARAMQARWKWVMADLEKKGKPPSQNDGLDFFGRMFSYIATCDFLMGKTSKWTGCDLAWIVNAENFAKIIEGRYENKVAA